jgi:hypothetical protein
LTQKLLNSDNLDRFDLAEIREVRVPTDNSWHVDSKGTFDKLGIIWIAIQLYGHAFHCDRFDKGKEFFLNQSPDLVNREVKLRETVE